MNFKTNSLVRMSGQFWKMTLDHKENIVLISTVMGLSTTLTFKAFIASVIRGTIQPVGGI